MMPVLILVAWIVIGAATGFYEARRGHWRWLWLLGAMAGPLAIPLARLAEQREAELSAPVVVGRPAVGRPGLRVVVGVDGSDAALDAAQAAVSLLGSRLGDLTLAMVVDFELLDATTAGPSDSDGAWQDRRQAEAALADAVERVAGSIHDGRPSAVLLAGEPSRALLRHADAEGYDLLVVGRRGRGLSKAALGSCASRLAQQTTVPVLVVPPATAGAAGADGSAVAGAPGGGSLTPRAG